MPGGSGSAGFSQQSATCAPWGWGSLSLRAPATAGGSRVLAGNQLARWLAVAMVGLNVVNRMFLIPAYRFWSRHRMIASRIQSGEPNASETQAILTDTEFQAQNEKILGQYSGSVDAHGSQ